MAVQNSSLANTFFEEEEEESFTVSGAANSETKNIHGRSLQLIDTPEQNTKIVLRGKTRSGKSSLANSLLDEDLLKESGAANSEIKLEQTTRIVLLGKTGSGKSSLANTLFGEKDLFKASGDPNSETKVCKSETKTIHGRSLQLIDTPGIFDTDENSPDLSPELLKCIVECAPGPHAFLLVLQVEKFTKQEQESVDLILKYFSEEALKFTTVVFTHGDQLDEGKKIEEWIKANKSLNDLVQKCGGRCHVFDNRYWKNSEDEYRNNQKQIKQLLKTIDQTMTENRGEHYTNEMLQDVQEKLEKEKEEIKTSSPNISKEELEKMAKKSVYSQVLKIGRWGAGVLMAAFVGGAGVLLAITVGAGVAGAGAAAAAGAGTEAAIAGAVGVAAGAYGTIKVITDYFPEAPKIVEAVGDTVSHITNIGTVVSRVGGR